MKTLSQIIKSLNEEYEYEDIEKMLSSFSPSGRHWGRETWIDRNYKMVSIGFHELGNWKVPSHVTGTEAQDYDWKVLDKKDWQKYKNEFKSWVSRQPWKDHIKKIEVSPEEKSWLMFNIYLK